MKAVYLHAAGAIALSFTIAACVPNAEPPAPAPPVVVTPAPTPAPAPPPVASQPVYENYLDAPQTEGTWTYLDEPGESMAMFGAANAAPSFMLRCDKGTGQIGMARRSLRDERLSMRVRTETTTRELTANPVTGRQLVAVNLQARDPLLDAMAITKGRFAIEVAGERSLYIPAWTEFSRVIEDCR